MAPKNFDVRWNRFPERYSLILESATPLHAPAQRSTRRPTPATMAPSIWSCGVVVSIVFCLMNADVAGAHPVGEVAPEIKENVEKTRRAISDQFLHDLELEFLRSQMQQNTESGDTIGRSRAQRAISDQILADLEQEWINNELGDSDSSTSRSKRGAMEDRSEIRRSIADHKLADFLARGRLQRRPSFDFYDTRRIGRREAKDSSPFVRRLFSSVEA